MKKPTFIVLHLYKGQTFNETLTFVDAAGDAIDLSGRTVQMHIRRDIADSVPVLELGTADGTISVNASGELAFNVAHTVTEALDTDDFYPEQWVYDIEWTLIDGTVERPVEGAVVVWPEVTRP